MKKIKRYNGGGLADDETRLARFKDLSSARKTEILKASGKALEDAEKERKRPLSSRALDALYEVHPLVSQKRKQEIRDSAAEDAARRESKYESARKDFSALTDPRSRALYGDDRVHKLDKEKNFKRGGSVSSASKRADGIAQRGKTKGRVL